MSDGTPIQWTDASWNWVVGCTYKSTGCLRCYAATLHNRRYLAWKRGRWPDAPEQYHHPFKVVQLRPDRLDLPARWRKPRRIFVASISDPFHESIPGEFINRAWMTMRNVKRHTYQLLTKRPERLLEWTEQKARATGWPIKEIWPEWVWLGTSVENQEAADERIPILLQVPTSGPRFLSCEPLVGPVDLEAACWQIGSPLPALDVQARQWRAGKDGMPSPVAALDWVIIGGESGKGARPMPEEWARSLVQQSNAAGVKVFMKQMGRVWAQEHSTADKAHGGIIDEWPEDLRVREYPTDRIGAA